MLQQCIHNVPNSKRKCLSLIYLHASLGRSTRIVNSHWVMQGFSLISPSQLLGYWFSNVVLLSTLEYNNESKLYVNSTIDWSVIVWEIKYNKSSNFEPNQNKWLGLDVNIIAVFINSFLCLTIITKYCPSLPFPCQTIDFLFKLIYKTNLVETCCASYLW